MSVDRLVVWRPTSASHYSISMRRASHRDGQDASGPAQLAIVVMLRLRLKSKLGWARFLACNATMNEYDAADQPYHSPSIIEDLPPPLSLPPFPPFLVFFFDFFFLKFFFFWIPPDTKMFSMYILATMSTSWRSRPPGTGTARRYLLRSFVSWALFQQRLMLEP